MVAASSSIKSRMSRLIPGVPGSGIVLYSPSSGATGGVGTGASGAAGVGDKSGAEDCWN